MPDARPLAVNQDVDDTMPSSDFPLATASSHIHASEVTTEADSIDDDSDLDVLSEQEHLGRTFELEDLTRNAGACGLHHQQYRSANMDEEKPPQPRRSKKARFFLYTPEEERAVLRKLDKRLVLFMALLYMLSFLDRSSKCFGSTPHSMLIWLYRYRKCKNCWFVTRLAAELFSI